MVKVSVTLAVVSLIFGRTVMVNVSFSRSVNWLMCHLADQSDIHRDRGDKGSKPNRVLWL